ncbi:hypothetical protein BDZ97DRAFT_1970237 [Flammula alnicola]|nr:hypothetical protein BDZ97DRAFT_1970237 [Flammula alnicola]
MRGAPQDARTNKLTPSRAPPIFEGCRVQSPSAIHQLRCSSNNTTTTAAPVTRTTDGEDGRQTARMATDRLRTQPTDRVHGSRWAQRGEVTAKGRADAVTMRRQRDDAAAAATMLPWCIDAATAEAIEDDPMRPRVQRRRPMMPQVHRRLPDDTAGASKTTPRRRGSNEDDPRHRKCIDNDSPSQPPFSQDPPRRCFRRQRAIRSPTLAHTNPDIPRAHKRQHLQYQLDVGAYGIPQHRNTDPSRSFTHRKALIPRPNLRQPQQQHHGCSTQDRCSHNHAATAQRWRCRCKHDNNAAEAGRRSNARWAQRGEVTAKGRAGMVTARQQQDTAAAMTKPRRRVHRRQRRSCACIDDHPRMPRRTECSKAARVDQCSVYCGNPYTPRTATTKQLEGDTGSYTFEQRCAVGVDFDAGRDRAGSRSSATSLWTQRNTIRTMPAVREEVRDAYTLETTLPPPPFTLHVVQHQYNDGFQCWRLRGRINGQVQEEARVTCRLEMVPTPTPFTFLSVERVCGLVVTAGCSWVEDLQVGGESGSRWGIVERAGRRSPSTSRVHRHQGCINDEPATLRAHRRHGYIDATGASTKSLRCHGAHRRRRCIDNEPHNIAAASMLWRVHRDDPTMPLVPPAAGVPEMALVLVVGAGDGK